MKFVKGHGCSLACENWLFLNCTKILWAFSFPLWLKGYGIALLKYDPDSKYTSDVSK